MSTVIGTVIVAALNGVASLGAALITYMKERNTLKNTTEMKLRKSLQVEQKSVDKTNAAIADQDTKEVRNELAE
jgi:hypothetical protein